MNIHKRYIKYDNPTFNMLTYKCKRAGIVSFSYRLHIAMDCEPLYYCPFIYKCRNNFSPLIRHIGKNHVVKNTFLCSTNGLHLLDTIVCNNYFKCMSNSLPINLDPPQSIKDFVNYFNYIANLHEHT